MRRGIEYTAAVSLIGDSFGSKIEILEKLIGHGHYPSIGGYKERLLKSALRDYLPRSFAIGTGFILFLRKPQSEEVDESFDFLNQAKYNVSRQCDLIIYDCNAFSPIFIDEDFVVVRPESVIAVIEVKGALGLKAVKEANEFFWDLSEKWKVSEKYHVQIKRPEHLKYPMFSIVAWDVQKDASGKVKCRPERIRNEICKFAREKFDSDPWCKRPFLTETFIYSNAIISHCVSATGNEHSVGYVLSSGQFLQRNSDGSYQHRGDRTISSLLARLHSQMTPESFSRFFSYPDEVKDSLGRDPFKDRYEKVWSVDPPKKQG